MVITTNNNEKQWDGDVFLRRIVINGCPRTKNLENKW